MVKIPNHYMRSGSGNPQARLPSLCEFPSALCRTTENWSPEPRGGQRPVNRRNYTSPAFWIEELESRGKKGVSYTDYHLTQQNHDFWKTHCGKVNAITVNHRSRPASCDPTISRSRSIDKRRRNNSGLDITENASPSRPHSLPAFLRPPKSTNHWKP